MLYLCIYVYSCIESFTLEIENDSETIDASLLQLITTCKSLYHVDVNAVVSTNAVDEICKLQEDGKISKYKFD